MAETFWEYLQRLRKTVGASLFDSPPSYAKADKERRERDAFHQRMRQESWSPEVTAGNASYRPKTEAELRAVQEAKQLQDQYLARKELFRQTGDQSLLQNAGGWGQPSPDPNPVNIETFSGRNLTNEPEFVRRMYDKNPMTLDNGDGTYSTHSMASATINGMEIAYPTVVRAGDQLVRLDGEQALAHALRTGEYKRFPTQKDADIYARGAWKTGLGQVYNGGEE